MRPAAGVQKDDDDTSCTGLITERLHARGLGFNTVSPVLLLEEVIMGQPSHYYWVMLSFVTVH